MPVVGVVAGRVLGTVTVFGGRCGAARETALRVAAFGLRILAAAVRRLVLHRPQRRTSCALKCTRGSPARRPSAGVKHPHVMLAHMAFGAPWHDQDLLAFDLETTGVDKFSDVPVSYALVRVCGGQVSRTDAALIDPGREIPAGASDIHGITTERARRAGMNLGMAIRHIADTLRDAWSHGVPVVGMKLDFDLTMLDACLRRETGQGLVGDSFCGPVLDTLVIDRHVDRYRPGKRTLAALCDHYGVVIEHAHDAWADAKAAADVLRALCDRYPELCDMSPADLHVAQSVWHAEWTASFAEWRLRKGLGPLRDEDATWPVASEPADRTQQAAI